MKWVAVLANGNGFGQINEVTMGWVSGCIVWDKLLFAGILSWYLTSQLDQLSLLPSAGHEMNIGQLHGSAFWLGEVKRIGLTLVLHALQPLWYKHLRAHWPQKGRLAPYRHFCRSTVGLLLARYRLKSWLHHCINYLPGDCCLLAINVSIISSWWSRDCALQHLTVGLRQLLVFNLTFVELVLAVNT